MLRWVGALCVCLCLCRHISVKKVKVNACMCERGQLGAHLGASGDIPSNWN